MFKNKTSKTDFVLHEKNRGFLFVFLSLFSFSPVNGVLFPEKYIYFFTSIAKALRKAYEGFPVSTQD